MKRLLSKTLGILLSVTMMVSFIPGMTVLAAEDTGSGEQAAEVDDEEEYSIDEVIAMIKNLPDPEAVTLEDHEAFDATYEAYLSLNETGWAAIDDKDETLWEKLFGVKERLEELDQQEAKKVSELIDAIGKVTLTDESKSAITKARNAYNELTDEQRRYVDNFNDLIAAEEEYSALEIDNVIGLIDKLPDPAKITLDDKKSVEAAREAFQNLNQVQQKEITNIDKLEACEEAIAKLEDEAEAKAVKAMIEALPDPDKVTLDDYEDIMEAWDAYFLLNDAQWDIIGDDLFNKLFKDRYYVELLDLQDTVDAAEKLIDECSEYISDEKMEALSEALEAAKKVLEADEKSLIEITDANLTLIDALWDANLDVWLHFDIIEGDDIVWLTGSSTSVKIRIKQLGLMDLAYDLFFDAGSVVLLDDKAIPADATAFSRGSLIIEIKPDFLKTLSVGAHKLTVKFDNGVSVDVSFMIKDAADVPASGESVSSAVYVGVAMIVLAGAAFVVSKKLTKREEI